MKQLRNLFVLKTGLNFRIFLSLKVHVLRAGRSLWSLFCSFSETSLNRHSAVLWEVKITAKSFLKPFFFGVTCPLLSILQPAIFNRAVDSSLYVCWECVQMNGKSSSTTGIFLGIVWKFMRFLLMPFTPAGKIYLEQMNMMKNRISSSIFFSFQV